MPSMSLYDDFIADEDTSGKTSQSSSNSLIQKSAHAQNIDNKYGLVKPPSSTHAQNTSNVPSYENGSSTNTRARRISHDVRNDVRGVQSENEANNRKLSLSSDVRSARRVSEVQKVPQSHDGVETTSDYIPGQSDVYNGGDSGGGGGGGSGGNRSGGGRNRNGNQGR